MPAMIGMSTAKATFCWIVYSNKPMTEATRNAVTRLIPSHTARCLALSKAGANMLALPGSDLFFNRFDRAGADFIA